jgi:hypothetical protein
MPIKSPASGARELFRYARVRPPRIFNLATRLETPREGNTETADAARAQPIGASTDSFDDLPGLWPELFERLKIDGVPEDRLPTRDIIARRDEFESYIRTETARAEAVKRQLTRSLRSAVRLGRRDDITRLSHALQFVELLPRLPRTTRRHPYAPVVLSRDPHKSRARVDTATAAATEAGARNTSSPSMSSRDVLTAWTLAADYWERRRQDLDATMEAIKSRTFTPTTKGKSNGKATKGAARARVSKARQVEYRAYIATKIEAMKSLAEESKRLAGASVREQLAMMKDDTAYLEQVARTHGDGAAGVVAKMVISTHRHAPSFPQLYAETKYQEAGKVDGSRRCVYESGNPCVDQLALDVPAIGGAEDVRPLGIAELVTVEERWLGYLPGEISAVENVLKGELRRKKVKSTKVFEEITERITQEIEEAESETQSTVKQDLSSSIETELSTRFNTDISASLNGTGGGTIGVVNLEGGASLGAGLALGIDSAISTSTESDFSQEIVSKAVERTKRTTSELRRSRSYQLFQTIYRHEIDNTGDGADHTSAIYCFLDKRICITERIYGLRQFLAAEILRPGVDLVNKEAQKHMLTLSDVGLPPAFDLSPGDISPENYLGLVGKLRASNVSPPPPPVKVVAKTYKTDLTNETREPAEFNVKKIAETLTPFFGQYKRFLIQDTIEIPEGYAVQDVMVTVTHGANGVSIPAHLPLSLLGASIYALPTIGVASVPPYTLFYLPLAIWQVLYTASPILHYNADSSNVTINVAHQTKESPYFFFEPDFLIREFLDALGNSFVMTEEFIDYIKGRLQLLYDAFTNLDGNGVLEALTDVNDEVREEINDFIKDLTKYLQDMITTYIPNLIAGDTASGPSLPSIPSLDPALVLEIPKAILAPFKEFFDAIIAHIEDLMQDSIGNLFELLIAMMDDTATKRFAGAKGITDALPVSFNCVSLKPGVTINLTVSMVRVDDVALDAWRLETFDRLNQAHYQLVADYQGRRNATSAGPAFRGSPGLMRLEELEVLKRRIMRALHQKYGGGAGGLPTLDELRLFEHAIDWENLTYRLFAYGPNGSQVAYEKLGFFAGADERRRQFMNAAWTQVMIPLREDDRLEQVMVKYLETGSVDFEADLLAQLDSSADPLSELTEIYRDLVLQRQQLPTAEPVYREEIIPTDLTIIYRPTDSAPYPASAVGCGG